MTYQLIIADEAGQALSSVPLDPELAIGQANEITDLLAGRDDDMWDRLGPLLWGIEEACRRALGYGPEQGGKK